MKFLLVLALFVTTNAFANVCSFEDVYSFEETMEQQNIRPYKVSADMKKLTAVEKQLIHKTVAQETWRGSLTVQESLEAFFDLETTGEQGSLAGEIKYFKLGGKNVILVHYYPGDNEYGAFFSENYKLIAYIGDSEIVCK